MIEKKLKNYIVYSNGEIFSKRSHKFIKGGVHDGYNYLRINGKMMKRARFIAKTFLLNPKNKPQVNHKNGIKNDDSVDNLEWVTASENVIHAYRTGLSIGKKTRTSFKPFDNHPFAILSKFQVQRMRLIKKITPSVTQKELGSLFNVARTTVGYILRNQSWNFDKKEIITSTPLAYAKHNGIRLAKVS